MRSKRDLDLVSARTAAGFQLAVALYWVVSQSFCREALIRQLISDLFWPESLTLLDSSTPPLEWNQYKVENALIGPVGSFCILWQFNQNQFSKFPAGMWLNYSAIGLFERGREGTRWRKYFLLFHLLRTAGSSIFLSYLFRWHFCGTQEHFNHITRTLFLLETVGWAWSEYPFSHAAHPADCD